MKWSIGMSWPEAFVAVVLIVSILIYELMK